MVPEWLATTSAPPSCGMFSMPRTSTRNHVLVQRPQQRQEDVVGEVRVEAELVDGVVAGQPAAQEREGVRDLALDVLAGEPGGLGGQPQHRDRDVHSSSRPETRGPPAVAGGVAAGSGGGLATAVRAGADSPAPAEVRARPRVRGERVSDRSAEAALPAAGTDVVRGAGRGRCAVSGVLGAAAHRRATRRQPGDAAGGAGRRRRRSPAARSPAARSPAARSPGTGSLSSGVRRRLARSPLARAAPAASASAPDRAPALPRAEPPRIGTTSGSAIRRSVPGVARGRGCRRPSRPDRGRGC